MKYHFECDRYFSFSQAPTSLYGEVYRCDHPVYNACTLYKIGDKGLAVIQQRYDPESKMTWWGPIDRCYRNPLYLSDKFKGVFDDRANICKDGIYPTMTLRQLMWALRLKPIKRQPWETVFDHRDI